MMWVVMRTGGKQYKTAPNESLNIENTSEKVGKQVEFDDILLVVENGKITLGQPIVKKTKVSATVIGHLRKRKLKIIKFKPKSKYLRIYGQKKELMTVEINSIARGD